MPAVSVGYVVRGDPWRPDLPATQLLLQHGHRREELDQTGAAAGALKARTRTRTAA